MASTLAGSIKSALFKARTLGISDKFRSARIRFTDSICWGQRGFETSTACISRLLSLISSSVARNAESRSGGRSRMKPTVSLIITSCSRGNLNLLEVGSSVANILCSACTSLLFRELSSVDFPLESVDAIAHAPSISFQFRFTWAASADAACQARKCRVVPDNQTGQKVLQLCQFYLDFSFTRLCSLREYIEDQLRAINHFEIGRFRQ